jgi:hypothetical protein
MSFKPYYRLGSNAATADFAQSLPLDVRAQRAKHLEERDRQQILAAARADVEAARKALEKVRDVSAEAAALDTAKKRLADLEGEVKHGAR